MDIGNRRTKNYRMRKTDNINVRLPGPLRKSLEEYARKQGETTSDIVRDAIKAFLWPRKHPMKSED